LRIMDARSSVMERTVDGEWYCVMNTWDEKMARYVNNKSVLDFCGETWRTNHIHSIYSLLSNCSCAAPQENLPAIGCPPWVNQDEILEGKKSN